MAPYDLKSKWAKARMNAHAYGARADRLAQELAEAEKALTPESMPTKEEGEIYGFETRPIAPGSKTARQPEPYTEASRIVAKVTAHGRATRRVAQLRQNLEAAEQACASAISGANFLDVQLQREAAVEALQNKAKAAEAEAQRALYAPRVDDGNLENGLEPTTKGPDGIHVFNGAGR